MYWLIQLQGCKLLHDNILVPKIMSLDTQRMSSVLIKISIMLLLDRKRKLKCQLLNYN